MNVALGLKRDAEGRYPITVDGEVVGHVFRYRSGWRGQLVGSEDTVTPYGYESRGSAYKAVERALERGGNRIVKIQPAPRIDNVIDGHELTQLPYPLHVRSHDGKVLDNWAERVVGFARDLSRQQIDVWWAEAVRDMDPSEVVGLYIVIQNSDGGYAVLDTAVQKVEVSH